VRLLRPDGGRRWSGVNLVAFSRVAVWPVPGRRTARLRGTARGVLARAARACVAAWLRSRPARFRPRGRKGAEAPGLRGRSPFWVVAVLALAAVWTLVCPVSTWDALCYDLPMAATYLQQGHLGAFPTQEPRLLASPHVGEFAESGLLRLVRQRARDRLSGRAGPSRRRCWSSTPGFTQRRSGDADRAWRGGVAMLLVLAVPQMLATATCAKPDLSAVALGVLAAWAAGRLRGVTPGPRGRSSLRRSRARRGAGLGYEDSGTQRRTGAGRGPRTVVVARTLERRQTPPFRPGRDAVRVLFVGLHSVRSYRACGTILGYPPYHVAEFFQTQARVGHAVEHNLRLLGELLVRPLTWLGRPLEGRLPYLGMW